MTQPFSRLPIVTLMLALAACGQNEGVGFDHYEVHTQSNPKPADEDAEWEKLKRDRGIPAVSTVE